jgi:thiosulfate/3-mercaptopyruvate sulfurtransferase
MALHTACLALALLVPAADKGKDDSYLRPELLIEPAELAKPEVLRGFRILDARPRKQYEAGHMPGAVWVDHDAWSKAFYADPDPQEWAGRIGKLGIGNQTRVVVYDDNRAKDAARIWWILRYAGVKDARLLNGGCTAWTAAGGTVSKEETAVAANRFTPDASQATRLATKGQVLKGIQKDTLQTVDARSLGEHCGTTTKARRNGAIPGSRHLEWSELLDATTQRFKSAAELRQLFREAGIDPNRPTVTYCQSGGRAAVMAFALELMGARDVRNYYRSWADWGNAEDTPVVQPKRK